MSWLPKRKVIVPIDYSDESIAAIDTARQLVAHVREITVVHVLLELSPLEPTEAWHTADAETRIRHVSTSLRKRLDDADLHDAKLEVLIGDPGREIADLAEREQADLIVLPSHGRTGLKRLLIGSVAERVVRLAHCPVLVLRGP